MGQSFIKMPADPQGKIGQIHAAARELFLRQGFGNTNMDAVAKLANVSKSTLYSHFENKAQLFAAVIGAARQRLYTGLTSVSTTDDTDVVLSLRQLGTQFLAYVVDPATITLFRVVIGETDKFPELGREVLQCGHQELVRIVSEFLQKWVDRGQLTIPDIRTAATQFLILSKSDLQMRCMMDVDKIATESEIEEAIDAALVMFMASYGNKTIDRGTA